MNVVIFGASGMIGTGALIECLEDPEIENVRVVGRTPTGRSHPKLEEIEHGDFLDFSAVEDRLQDLDACLWCLGVSAAGMSEADYRRVTLEFTREAAQTLLRLNPQMSICFISGGGTRSPGQGGPMWARVKGEAEALLLEMGFKHATMFRPSGIQPVKGAKSKTMSYRIAYALMTPLAPILNATNASFWTTSSKLGRALIHAAKHGAPKPILEGADINALVATL